MLSLSKLQCNEISLITKPGSSLAKKSHISTGVETDAWFYFDLVIKSSNDGNKV